MSTAVNYELFKSAGGDLNFNDYSEAVDTLKDYNQLIRQRGDYEDLMVEFLAALSSKQRNNLYYLFSIALAIVYDALSSDMHKETDHMSADTYTNTANNLALMWPSSLAVINNLSFASMIDKYYKELYPLIDDPQHAEEKVLQHKSGDFTAKLGQLQPLIQQLNAKINPPQATAQALVLITELFEQLNSQLVELKSK